MTRQQLHELHGLELKITSDHGRRPNPNDTEPLHLRLDSVAQNIFWREMRWVANIFWREKQKITAADVSTPPHQEIHPFVDNVLSLTTSIFGEDATYSCTPTSNGNAPN